MSPSVLLIWLVVALNLSALATMGWDKWCARRHRRRVPEKRLWAMALLSGSLGVWVGMMLFRHKTQHIQFVVGVPLLVAIHSWLAWRVALLLF